MRDKHLEVWRFGSTVVFWGFGVWDNRVWFSASTGRKSLRRVGND